MVNGWIMSAASTTATIRIVFSRAVQKFFFNRSLPRAVCRRSYSQACPRMRTPASRSIHASVQTGSPITQK